MALKLDILANTRQLVSEMKKGGASVEDVSDALDDLASNGGTVERSFRDLAKAGTKSAGEVKKGFKDLKDEAGQSGREAAASFSGEWSDVGDFVQETVANGLAGLGPLGAAAGLAGAAGIGIVTNEIVKQQEEADKLRDRLTGAYADAAEEGRKYLDQAAITADVHDLVFNTDRLDEWKRLQEDANRLGIERGTIYSANAGDLDAQRIVQAAINDLVESEAGSYETIRDGLSRVNPEVQAMADRWGLVIDETQRAKQGTEEYAQYVASTEERNREQIDRTATAAQSRYEGLAATYGKGITVPIYVDESNLNAARARAEAWARSGLNVAVNGTLSGKGVWE